jgi:hypothetical protein
MTIIWKLQYWQKFEDLYVKKSTLKTDYDKVQKLIWKRYELFLDLLNKIQELSYDFCIFWYFSEMFLDRKSHGSGLWITGPRLSLDPWWTHDHGAVRPIRGSGGHRDSSERERESGGHWGSYQWRHLEAKL